MSAVMEATPLERALPSKCVICASPLPRGQRLCGRHRHMTPAAQLAVLLAREREDGVPFDEAWERILDEDKPLVAWPQPTTDRREWKAILGSRKQREAWRRAYDLVDDPELRNLRIAVAA